MKKYIKYIIPCLVIAFSFSSCYDTMDDKASIDALYETLAKPVVNSASAVADTYETATATGSVDDLENVQEVGFQVSTDMSFADYITFTSEEVTETFTAEIRGLEGNTTYYIRSYAFTKTGIAVYGEVSSFTTPKSPIFDVDGVYTVTEYELDDNDVPQEEEGTYKIEINFIEGSDTEVEITNIWGAEGTVVGVWEETEDGGTITIPTNQVIGVHPVYGDIYMRALNNQLTAYADNVILTFTKKGGLLSSSYWAAAVSAGTFGWYIFTAVHDEVE